MFEKSNKTSEAFENPLLSPSATLQDQLVISNDLQGYGKQDKEAFQSLRLLILWARTCQLDRVRNLINSTLSATVEMVQSCWETPNLRKLEVKYGSYLYNLRREFEAFKASKIQSTDINNNLWQQGGIERPHILNVRTAEKKAEDMFIGNDDKLQSVGYCTQPQEESREGDLHDTFREPCKKMQEDSADGTFSDTTLKPCPEEDSTDGSLCKDTPKSETTEKNLAPAAEHAARFANYGSISDYRKLQVLKQASRDEIYAETTSKPFTEAQEKERINEASNIILKSSDSPQLRAEREDNIDVNIENPQLSTEVKRQERISRIFSETNRKPCAAVPEEGNDAILQPCIEAEKRSCEEWAHDCAPNSHTEVRPEQNPEVSEVQKYYSPQPQQAGKENGDESIHHSTAKSHTAMWGKGSGYGIVSEFKPKVRIGGTDKTVTSSTSKLSMGVKREGSGERNIRDVTPETCIGVREERGNDGTAQKSLTQVQKEEGRHGSIFDAVPVPSMEAQVEQISGRTVSDAIAKQSPEVQEGSTDGFGGAVSMEPCTQKEQNSDGTTNKTSKSCGEVREKESTGKAISEAIPESSDDAEKISVLITEKMRQKATRSKAIGSEGGEISLFGCSVVFPEAAVKEETEFTLEVDNNPENFPPNVTSITPIMGLEPHMEFEEDVTVIMETCYSAADKNEIPGEIWSQEKSGEWEFTQKTMLKFKNEVSFKVRHFSNKNVAVQTDDSITGVYHLSYDVYIQEGTAVISSVFCKDSKTLSDYRDLFSTNKCTSLIAIPEKIRCRIDSTISATVDCKTPKSAKYIATSELPGKFKFTIDQEADKHIRLQFLPCDFPPQFSGSFMAYHSLTVEDDHSSPAENHAEDDHSSPVKKHILLSMPWPLKNDPSIQNTINNASGPVSANNNIGPGANTNLTCINCNSTILLPQP